MESCFRALSKQERAEFRRIYLDYLRERNGDADPQARTCANREAVLRLMADDPVRTSAGHRLDQVVFARNQVRQVPEPGLPLQLLWAICAANVNLVQAWGVDYTFRLRDERDVDDPHTWVLIEERYHARMLADCVRVLGVDMAVLPPSPLARTVLRGTLRIPRSWSSPLILASEVVGIVAFESLQRMARELFGYEPRVLARIDAIFDQIVTDEIGHVMWLQSNLDAPRLALARRLVPVVARAFLYDIPVAGMLFGRSELLERIRETVRTGDVGFGDGRVHPLEARLGRSPGGRERLAPITLLEAAA